jgi:putative ABC transport system substrate-binding protein
MIIDYKLRFISKFLFVLFIVSLLFQFGCTTENNIVEQPKSRTLFILTDDNAGSDLMLKITGSVRANYPDVDIQFVQSKLYNIKEAAYFLEEAASSYPAGSYFFGRVDPGSGTKKMVFNTPNGSHFLVPDNGIATRVIKTFKPQNFYYAQDSSIYGGKNYLELSSADYYVKTIFAMLSGTNESDFGPAVVAPVTYQTLDPYIQNDTIYGEVLFTDNFGNCITNIADTFTKQLAQKDLLKITAGSKSFFTSFGTSYNSVTNGSNVSFVNNTKRIEIAVDNGNISQRYSIAAGTHVAITKGMAKVGLLLYNESSVVTDIVQKSKNELASQGLVEGVNVTYFQKSAHGDNTLLAGLINELINYDVDVIVSVSTPASQAAVNLVPDSIPVIFTYVTDPQSAGIIGKRKHVSGLSDATNFNDYVNFVTQLLPNLKKAGSIYNNTESNSIFAQQQLSSLLDYKNIVFSQSIAVDTFAIPNAYTNLKSQNVEAILIVADNTLSLGMNKLAKLAITDHLPVIGDSYQHASDGALASISVDYDALATSTGDFILSVIRGVDPDNEPIRKFPTNVIAVNKTTANSIGFTFPPDILSKAKYVYQ